MEDEGRVQPVLWEQPPWEWEERGEEGGGGDHGRPRRRGAAAVDRAGGLLEPPDVLEPSQRGGGGVRFPARRSHRHPLRPSRVFVRQGRHRPRSCLFSGPRPPSSPPPYRLFQRMVSPKIFDAYKLDLYDGI